METRQELILRFMTALAGTDYHAKMLDTAGGPPADDERKARDVYLSAALLADAYLSRI